MKTFLHHFTLRISLLIIFIIFISQAVSFAQVDELDKNRALEQIQAVKNVDAYSQTINPVLESIELNRNGESLNLIFGNKGGYIGPVEIKLLIDKKENLIFTSELNGREYQNISVDTDVKVINKESRITLISFYLDIHSSPKIISFENTKIAIDYEK